MTSWWNKNVETRINDFKSWTGDFNQPSKIYCRNYIVSKQYKNIIDCGCGLATDYFGFKNDGHEINYTGLDSCKYLIDLNRSNGMAMIEAELNADLPLSDNSYECVYCREVLEHLPYYEKTIKEFVRIASKEIMIVFFIKPLEENEWVEEIKNKIEKQKKERQDAKVKQEEEKRKLAEEAGIEFVPDPEEPETEIIIKEEEKEINYWKEEDLYHNKYDKKKLESFIMSLPKVDKLFWANLNDFGYVSVVAPDETPKNETVQSTADLTNNKFILHILLK